MATPISPAYAYHNRFNLSAQQPNDADPASDPSQLPRASSDNYSYPDLDAGQYHSSSAAQTTGGTVAADPLPDFPEFKAFEFDSEFASAQNHFARFAPVSKPASSEADQPVVQHPQPTHQPLQQPVASSAAEAPPASPQQDVDPTPSFAAADSAASIHSHHQDDADPDANAQTLPDNDGAGQRDQTPATFPNPKFERGFSSASMYQSPPAEASVPIPPLLPKSEQRNAGTAVGRTSTGERPADLQSSQSSIQQHAAPVADETSRNSSNDHRVANAAEGPLPSNFAFPSSGAGSTARDEDLVSALRMNDLDLNESAPMQQLPQQAAERARPSSFFGMERPLAAVNASGQHVPVPRGMIPGEDDDDQVHVGGLPETNSNGLNQAAVNMQRRELPPGASQDGPRPSSFFGVGSGGPDPISPTVGVDEDPHVGAKSPVSATQSFHRSEGPYRGISTAAGGTGNAPMPASNGYGGLGPSGSTRPASIAPTISSGPLLDHSHLKPGQRASLLSHGKTLELYRQNAKKTNDPNLIYELAVFMIDASKTMGTGEDAAPSSNENSVAAKEELVKEATGLLKKIADRGHPDAQYFLADCYANGIGTSKGKQDFGQAYTYFVLAAKHGHPDAAYRAGTCYEKGWGCRKDNGKALQFYRKSASQSHPGAMYRLATAELNGELGLKKSAKEGVKWLKRSAEAATPEFPHALHELALLHERGIDNVLFVDPEYSCELLAQAGEMGYAPSAYKLGVNYEYGRMGCPQDGGLSIHMYNIAAQQNHKEACFALTAWYLVGAPGILPQSDTEAYLWAKKAAEQGLAKAEYAVGYFTEMGIGTVKDVAEAKAWYRSAADHGDKRAHQRLAVLGGRPEKSLAGVGAGGVTGPAQRRPAAMSTDYGKRGQPTSAPFPGSVDRNSMGPSAGMSYPSPMAMRDAQTAQREQQYMANVVATERAQARAAAMRSGPPSAAGGAHNSVASPVAELDAGLSHKPFTQAYPSYPASASTAMPNSPALAGAAVSPNGGGLPQQRPAMATSPAGNSAIAPSSPPDEGDDGKKKKKWFGRS